MWSVFRRKEVPNNIERTNGEVVVRKVAVTSSFLILHLSIISFSVIGYFFSPDDTPHTPNPPSKSLERDHGSSVGDIDVIIEITPTSHVLIVGFSTVGSSGMFRLLLLVPSWFIIKCSLIP